MRFSSKDGVVPTKNVPVLETLERRELFCLFGHDPDEPARLEGEAPPAQLASFRHHGRANRRPDRGASGLAVPASLIATVISDSVVQLDWEDRSKEERGFRVERSLDGKNYEKVARVGSDRETWTDKKTPGDSRLYYRVRSVTKNKASRPSDVVQVVTGAHFSGSPITSLKWTAMPSLPGKRFEGNNAAVGGKFYVFGGYHDFNIRATADAHVYDPKTNAWSSLPDMPQAVTHAGVAVDGNTVWFAGGYVGNWQGYVTGRVMKYDTVSRAWSSGPSLPSARGAGALVKVGRELHFYGGVDTSYKRDRGDHWVLDLDEGKTWTLAPSMPDPRNHFGYAELDGYLYAIGGQRGLDETSGNSSQVQRYDTRSKTWSNVATLPRPWSHTHTSTTVLDGKIVIVGGGTNGTSSPTPLRDVMQYDPAKNEWTSLAPLPAAWEAISAKAIDGKIYTAGGATVKVNVGAYPTSDAYVGAFESTSPPPAAPAGGATYHAENAARVGVNVLSNFPGFTGSGFADYVNSGGDYLEWSVSSSTSRTYTLEFRYANGSGDRPLKLGVNGATTHASLSFPGTGSWSTWKTVNVSVTLKAGVNKIRLTDIGQSGANIDRLVVR